jgi:nucleoside-diphosphate-sugar epimerase
MRVLVTGGAGYIGSELVRELLHLGHKVVCLDRFFFGKESVLDILDEKNLVIIKDDIRWFEPKILKDIDVVMDLAALSNDPAGEIDQAKTFDINYLGRIRVARLSKEYGVKKYILASSCSIYGYQQNVLDEDSPAEPLTTYAKASKKAEDDVLPLSSSQFTVTVLRFATVYGCSKRMRFDLAINAMVLDLFKNSKIHIMRDGNQWRPFIHIKDAIQAYRLVMKQSSDNVNGTIFNVGSDNQNYQILQLAQGIAKVVDIPYEVEWYGSPDFRSYKVSFKKFKTELGFEAKHSPEDGASEIISELKNGSISDSLKTRTVDWYKHLIKCSELSSQVMMRGVLL